MIERRPTFDYTFTLQSVIVFLCIYYHREILMWLRVVYYTFSRDAIGLVLFLKTKLFIHKLRTENATVAKVFRDVVNRFPDKKAIVYESGFWTFKQLDEYSNRVAHYLISQGFVEGDEISLMMEGRPEYIGIWLGASKAGVVTAFINTHLKAKSLVHSITVVKSKALIVTPTFLEEVKEILPQLSQIRPGIKILYYGNKSDENLLNVSNGNNNLNNNNNNVNGLISDATTTASNFTFETLDEKYLSSNFSAHMSKSEMKGSFGGKLFYIYTSGTTGLPKAAIIRHARYIFLGTGANNLMGIKSNSTIYTPIPLYHMAGGALGTCQCLIFGNTIVIRDKFSASKFWSDCMKFECTAAQYIGEICRYLLLQPPSPQDSGHKVRLMFGNGLRPVIWKEFQARFKVKKIAEFYGATEGNASVVNYTGKAGACGFLSQILPKQITSLIYPVSIIRVNEETGEPIRDKTTGLCTTCGPGETGEFVGKIVKEDPSRSFDGYVSREATEKKVYRDVFKKGDLYFSSGDLLNVDDLGYVYFKDRTGDTFRWKGENVSTTEVESVIASFVGLSDIVVYGVPVPSCEGRAGMASIAIHPNDMKLDDFYSHMRNSLPPYAIPCFVRLNQKIETTGTFKLPKVSLQKEGFKLESISDPIFYLDVNSRTYQRLDQTVYQDILSGKMRF